MARILHPSRMKNDGLCRGLLLNPYGSFRMLGILHNPLTFFDELGSLDSSYLMVFTYPSSDTSNFSMDVEPKVHYCSCRYQTKTGPLEIRTITSFSIL